ncbi:NAD(P)-binding protein [Annulohypoxylon maeteangense]|uniref:NAD(P)-binding protein n=1 Tax=Annulohypoxylon maeteangense TaxID=1927788 RepID=UPI0020076020|nr:NAD(P)-binding protein [Annulohypoxylon maeteangense]KAI0888540.1 NAD(P)-binding protein [Annulohypoxylon maeteangense]
MSDYNFPLSNKVALVTGSSRGIGKGIALELARRGATVILTYVSQGSEVLAREVCRTIEALPHKPRSHAIRVDLSTLDGARSLIGGLLEWSEGKLKIDILVNNAGIEKAMSLAEVTIDDYNDVYNLNIRGTILLTQAILPYLNSNGRIINIGSVAARTPFKNFSLYCSSKAALEGLTRVWAAELGGNGTTVNCVEPGPVQSDMLDDIPKDIVNLQKILTPIGNRIGTVDEVSNIVASLASKDGAWITGQTISASGGFSMY